MTHRHCIVWLDHFHAVIVNFSDDSDELIEIASEIDEPQLHRKSGKPGSGHLPDDLQFFQRVATTVRNAPEILITGPGTAKTAFDRFLHERFADVTSRVHGVETLDHPSHGELLAYGRKRFRAIDQLLGTR